MTRLRFLVALIVAACGADPEVNGTAATGSGPGSGGGGAATSGVGGMGAASGGAGGAPVQCRPAAKNPITNVAGWDAPDLQPQNATTTIAAARDGSRVALLWNHNAPGTTEFDGAPTAY